MSQQYNDNQTLFAAPNSLQRSLERVDNLLAQSEEAQAYGNFGLANQKVRDALQVIASASPELAVLLAVGEMGYSGYDIDILERVDSYQLTERKFLGLNFGNEVVNTPTITRKTIRGRLI